MTGVTLLMLGVIAAVVLTLGTLVWRDIGASVRKTELLMKDMDGAPAAMQVPRRDRAPDVPRAWALIQEARVLLASAEGALLAPAPRHDGTEADHAWDDDVLDAVTHLREAFGMLREAAELDPDVERALAPHDPWTEPAWLDALHMGATTAGQALREGREWISAVTRALRQLPEAR